VRSSSGRKWDSRRAFEMENIVRKAVAGIRVAIGRRDSSTVSRKL
jgi:hypothetical protein